MITHVPYTAWQYLYPPRTEMKIEWNPEGRLQKTWTAFPDVIAQFKLNGSRNLIVIRPDDGIEFWNRHKERQGKGKYVIPPTLLAQIRAMPYPRGKWNIIDGELMHYKVEYIKDTLYLFDVLVWGSEHLIGETYEARYKLLGTLVGDVTDNQYPLDFRPKVGKIYIAQSLSVDRWAWAWQQAQLGKTEIEGLVLKRNGAVSCLGPANKQINNNGFMLRIRKPHKNFQY